MKRNATAVWNGDLKGGRGSLTTQSTALTHAPYSFGARFENEKGTNPEELVAAAHAGCFSMSLAGELQKIKLIADSIETKAELTIERLREGYRITGIHLTVSAQIPDATEAQFAEAADVAKQNCPISKLLNAPITLEKKLLHSPVTPLQEAG